MIAELLDHLVTADPTFSPVDIADWQPEAGSPLQSAILGGFAADRIGVAFSAGYQAACRRLLPAAPEGWLLALCATESGGNHPRAIATRLSEGTLTGEKRFVSMGTLVRGLLVVASEGAGEDGRNRLKMVLVDAQASGVRLTAQPALPFIPEIPHATLTLEAAPAAKVLPGDGYTGYLKPFRTIEDVHVHLALLAHLVAVGRISGWRAETMESLLDLLCALSPLSAARPSSLGVHRALGGVLARVESVLRSLDLSAVPPEIRRRWERDAPLLQIAGRTRQARLAAARGRTGLSG